MLISLLSGRSLNAWFCLLSRSAQGSPPKYLYIEMELCSTKNLRSWIQKKNLNQTQKSKEEGLSVFRSIVCGVAYIHSSGLIHRDLKVRWTPLSPSRGGIGLEADFLISLCCSLKTSCLTEIKWWKSETLVWSLMRMFRARREQFTEGPPRTWHQNKWAPPQTWCCY